MSFLDSLENNLKALENLEERDPEQVKRAQERRAAEKSRAAAIAPHAEELKSGEFTKKLLDELAVLGHKNRTKVHITWIGEILRLQARETKLELTPTPDGIEAHLIRPSGESVEPLDEALASKLFS
jgi:hypothetical protein